MQRQSNYKSSADLGPQPGLDREVGVTDLHTFELGSHKIPPADTSHHVMPEDKIDALELAGDARAREPAGAAAVHDDVDAAEHLRAELDYDAIVFGAHSGIREDGLDNHMAGEGGKSRALQHSRGPHGSRSA